MLIDISEKICNDITAGKLEKVKQRLRSMLGEPQNKGLLSYIRSKIPSLYFINPARRLKYREDNKYIHTIGGSRTRTNVMRQLNEYSVSIQHESHRYDSEPKNILLAATKSGDLELLNLVVKVLKLKNVHCSTDVADSIHACITWVQVYGDFARAEILLDLLNYYDVNTRSVYHTHFTDAGELFKHASTYENEALMIGLLDYTRFNVNYRVSLIDPASLPLTYLLLTKGHAPLPSQHKIIQAMLDKGLDLHLEPYSYERDTALHLAARGTGVSAETLSILMLYANMSSRNRSNESVLDCVCATILNRAEYESCTVRKYVQSEFDSEKVIADTLDIINENLLRKYVLLKNAFKANNISVNQDLLTSTENVLKRFIAEHRIAYSKGILSFALDNKDHSLFNQICSAMLERQDFVGILQELLSSYPIFSMMSVPVPKQNNTYLPHVLVHKIASFVGSPDPLKAVAIWYRNLSAADKEKFRNDVLLKLQAPWFQVLHAALDLERPEPTPSALTFSQAASSAGVEHEHAGLHQPTLRSKRQPLALAINPGYRISRIEYP